MQPQPKNDLVYLLTILEAAGKLAIYCKGFISPIDFFQQNDQLNFNASLLLIATIGEQVAKISELTKSRHTNIPWQKIKDTRNRIVHDYTGIDYDTTFQIVTKELTGLKSQIEQLIRQELMDETFSREDLEVARNSTWYRHVNFNILYS